MRFSLVPTGLALAGSVFSACASAQAESAPASTTTLPAIEVVGRTQGGAYHAHEASGSKSDLPLRELPQAVRVMSRQTLDDLGATRLDDALDFVGGVSRQNNFGGLWDNMAIRGLTSDMNTGMPLLLNGLSGNRGFNAPRDTASLERIEFLKGPAAALYGSSEPGGTVNLVTKKPLRRPAHAVEAYVGSFDFYRATVDSTGPLSKEVAYRLNAAVETRGGFRDFVDADRVLVAPALAWKIAPTTRLDYYGEFLRQQTPLDRGVVAIGNQLGAVPRERFLGEPADGDVRIDNQTHQLSLDHVLNDVWSARLGMGWKSGTLEGFSTEAQAALQADGRTLRRQRRYRDYASDDLTLQGELTARVAGDTVSHEVLIGAEAFRFEIDQLMLRANPTDAAPYAINVFNPVYGQPQPTPLPFTDTHEEQNNLALYVQDAISIGRNWRVVAGVRHDRYQQDFLDRRSGAVTSQSPSETSPRLGVSYLPNEQWTLFANAGRSFRPNSGADAAGNAFAPESGRALEAGVKWENPRRTLGATLALFDLRKQNMLTAATGGFSIATGELESRGLDFDLSGQLSPQWRINASLSYIDAQVRRDNTLEVGSRLLNVPRLNASALLMHERSTESGARYGIGGGFAYTGERLGEARTQAQAAAGTPAFELPAYTVAKLAAYWRISPALRLSLDVDNLFDKTYYTQSFQRTWVAPGAPRTVTLGLQAKF